MTTRILTPGNAVSPIDGRYAPKTVELSEIFSEQALMKYRLAVEVKYLYFLSLHEPLVREISQEEKGYLDSLFLNFSEEDFKAIIQHEKVTNHDVEAVKYFLRDKLNGTSLENMTGFVHIGRTSEDINNLAYAFMLREGTHVLVEQYKAVAGVIGKLSDEHKDTSMLALTHGQPASPTTFGWEMHVFQERLNKYLVKLESFSLSVKCNGATGGDNALHCFSKNNWRKFSEEFISSLNKADWSVKGLMQFEYNPFTTQIESHDTYAELFGILSILNTILIDFTRDMWMYISRGVVTQKPVDGEVGSSAMPQKINPINFENAEGNLGMANTMFDFFRNKLPVSRMQRDLSDSTVERNFGSTYAYTLIALKAVQAGMKRVYVNTESLQAELEDAWEVVSEAYQVILRREGVVEGYELLKEATRGKKITKEIIHEFIIAVAEKYKLSPELVEELQQITPHNYIGNRSF